MVGYEVLECYGIINMADCKIVVWTGRFYTQVLHARRESNGNESCPYELDEFAMISRECIDVISEIAEQLGYLTPLEPVPMPTSDQMELVLSMDYQVLDGDGATQRSGTIYVGFGPGLAQHLAVNMVGSPNQSAISLDIVQEAAVEMVNVLSGNLLPLVYGLQREFRLSSAKTSPKLAIGGIQSAALSTDEGILAVVIQEAA